MPMTEPIDLDMLAEEARSGSKEALERLVMEVQGYIYNLALRMLQLPMDAEDATQEILVKLITHLGQFRGDSRFTTWMYRVASNHLLNRVQTGKERLLTFDGLAAGLEESLSAGETGMEEAYADSELSEQVKRHCTLGMLVCLSRRDRIVLVLGELLGLAGDEAASVLGLSSAAYRQRLSRARQKLVSFIAQQCGVVNTASACRCHKHVDRKLKAGQLDPTNPMYPDGTPPPRRFNPPTPPDSVEAQALALLCSHPTYAPSADFVQTLRHMFTADDSAL